MKRGRRPARNAEEFSAMVCNRREFFGYSVAALAKLSGVNRGTLSEFFNGRRNGFGYNDRLRLIRTFNLGPEAEGRFLDEEHRRIAKSPLILLDPPTSPHPPLEKGQQFLICASYTEAMREFEAVYDIAHQQRDYVLQADAAARTAWVLYEKGLYRDALLRVSDGIKLLATHTGATFDQIMDSIRPSSYSALCSLNEEASHVLSRLLQIRYKCYIERVVYCGRVDLRQKATEAVEQSAALDRHLQLPAAIGHDLRWQAVLTISGFNPQTDRAKRLLTESQEKFAGNGLGVAYLARDRGIFSWQTEHYAKAHGSLADAIDQLASFADSRALGPAFCVRTKVALETGADAGTIRRYALAGAALHPYGFVLDNARECIKGADERGLRRDIDELLSGAKQFEKIAPVLSRLTDGSPGAMTNRLKQNVSRILDANVHSWLRHPMVQPRTEWS
jgi:transcriptional regulator with XRE-family HTH domain